MGAAFGWGLRARSSLVIGSLIAIWLLISLRVIGSIMGFGAGVLISAVAFDLVEEATEKSSGQGVAVWGLFIGCGVFFGGDWLITLLGGGDRKDAGGDRDRRRPGARLLGGLRPVPEAFEHGGKLVGVVTTLGFATAYGIHAFA